MPDLIRGQRLKIADLTPSMQLELGVRVAGPAHEYDVSLFGLDPQGKLSDDRYMVFYNQKQSPEGAIQMLPQNGGETRFAVDLSRVPRTVERMMVTASVDSGAFSQISSGHLALYAGGNEVARFPFHGADFGTERAIIVAELYLKDVWRLSAVGQGFAGGLDALVAAYGGEVKATPAAPVTPSPAPVSPVPISPVPISPAPVTPVPVNTQRPAPPGQVSPVQTPPPAAPASPVNTQRPAPAAPVQPPSAPIRLTKVTLEKQGQRATISLSKGNAPQPIHVNLNWDKGGGTRKGIFGLPMAVANADLDLGCMYVMKDGEMGAIQALGNRFGSERFAPYIMLDKDDRSGQASDGENLYILRPELIQQVLVFAFIYEGTSDFTSVNGRLNIKDAGGNEIAIRLNNPDARRTFCAIAMFENVGGKIEVSKEERYFQGHQDCDEHYGFGFRWTAGSK
ncbi:TerD family protein [Deinococcus altitudinis]|uniref:TerD family protein n=1 Tax=Deinococcus altitudinis TaxID=468914 RepID=UPI003891727E